MGVVITEPEYDFLSSLRFWSDSILFKKINKQSWAGRIEKRRERERKKGGKKESKTEGPSHNSDG